MEWSRIKTILICLLLFVNLYLGFSVVSKLSEQSSAEEDMLYDACSILESRGISFPSEMLLDMPKYLNSYDFPRDISLEKEVASGILGNCGENMPGGEIYVYSADNDSFTFRSGGYIEAVFDQQFEEDDLEALLADKLVNGLDCESESGGYSLTFNGFPVRGAQVSVSDGGSSFSGKWVFSREVLKGSQSMSRAELALAMGNILRNSGQSSIKEVSAVYIHQASQSGGVSLVPAWKISCPRGEVMYINALTGQKMPIS